jgi:hypothetical protein
MQHDRPAVQPPREHQVALGAAGERLQRGRLQRRRRGDPDLGQVHRAQQFVAGGLER